MQRVNVLREATIAEWMEVHPDEHFFDDYQILIDQPQRDENGEARARDDDFVGFRQPIGGTDLPTTWAFPSGHFAAPSSSIFGSITPLPVEEEDSDPFGGRSSSDAFLGLYIAAPCEPTYCVEMRQRVTAFLPRGILADEDSPESDTSEEKGGEGEQYEGADMFSFCNAYLESNRVLLQRIHNLFEGKHYVEWNKAILEFGHNCNSIIAISMTVSDNFLSTPAILIPEDPIQLIELTCNITHPNSSDPELP